MPKMKYIVVRDDHCANGMDNGPERAIIFDKELVHAHVAKLHRVGGLVVVSAGFVEINGYNVRTYGASESLGKSSREKDLQVVTQALLGDGDYRGFDEIAKQLSHVESLIDGDENDDFGVFLAPIRNLLKSLLPAENLPKQG